MAVLPAGQVPGGPPLTACESAVLIAIDEWANDNTEWFNYTNTLKGTIGFGFVLFVVGIVFPPLLVLGILFTLIPYLILRKKFPSPVVVPPISATRHFFVNAFGNKNIVTQNSSLFTGATFSEALVQRDGHNPLNYIEENDWLKGFHSSGDLSFTGMKGLVNEDEAFIYKLQHLPRHDLQLQLVNQSLRNLRPNIISSFDSTSVYESVEHFAMDFDKNIAETTQSNIDFVQNTLRHNDSLAERIHSEMLADMEQYNQWIVQLKESGNYYFSLGQNSTNIGWERGIMGLNQAQKSLENYVAADIIAQEESVNREIEQAESRMREKSADFQLQIAEEQEKLNRRLLEVNGMVDAQSRVVHTLSGMDIPRTLTYQSTYGVTSGGGGSVSQGGGYISSVTTSVKTDFYEVRNPAIDTVDGLVVVAKGDLKRYEGMKSSLNNEIGQLSSSYGRMVSHLKEQQEKRLEELSEAKERAINAILKDSHQVKDIQRTSVKDGLSPFERMNELVMEIWLRPTMQLNDFFSEYRTLVTIMENYRSQIHSQSSQISHSLSGHAYNDLNSNYITQHWVIYADNLVSEIIPITKIEFNEQRSVQIEQGSSMEVFGLNPSQVVRHHLELSAIQNAILRLQSLGLVDEKVVLALTKAKENQLQVVVT